MIARIAYALAVTAFLVAPIGSAQAAPQVLAVLSSSSGIPFICASGECRAELTTYCLQQDREYPRFGDAYRPARGSDFALVITDSEGVQRQLPARENVKFSSIRGFMATAAVIPQAVVARHGIVSATIKVAENASLVPLPVTADVRPMTDGDVATATGPLRKIGSQIVDASKSATAAQLLMRATSRFTRVEDFQRSGLPGLWRSVHSEIRTDLRHPGGLAIARNTYDSCVTEARAHIPERPMSRLGNKPLSAVEFASNMLRCLHRTHDSIVRDINVTYWKSLAGS